MQGRATNHPRARGGGSGRNARLRHRDDAESSKPGANAKIERIVGRRQFRVKAAELLPDRTAHQHAVARDGEHVIPAVMLTAYEDTENIFNNTLTWDDYTKWNGGVSSFNIYRAVNGVFDPSPITTVSVGTKTYIDNVENYVSDQGKFSYYVEAVEGAGNIYGFLDKAKSNPADICP